MLVSSKIEKSICYLIIEICNKKTGQHERLDSSAGGRAGNSGGRAGPIVGSDKSRLDIHGFDSRRRQKGNRQARKKHREPLFVRPGVHYGRLHTKQTTKSMQILARWTLWLQGSHRLRYRYSIFHSFILSLFLTL